MARKTGVLKAVKAAMQGKGKQAGAPPAAVAPSVAATTPTAAVATTVAQVQAAGTPPNMAPNRATLPATTLLVVVGPKKELTGTKFNGTPLAWQAVQQLHAAAGGGKATLTFGAVQAAVKGVGNPGFARYAIRMGWLVPQTK